MDEEAAASRIQSIKRGQQSRAQVAQMKQEENAAATKMAAAKRGKDARDQVKRSRQGRRSGRWRRRRQRSRRWQGCQETSHLLQLR